MADVKVAPVEGGLPTTETVQRTLYGRHYDALKKREQELAEKAPKSEPQAPWPTTADVQRTIAGGVVEPKPTAAAPAPTPAPAQKAAEADPTRANYKTRKAEAEK